MIYFAIFLIVAIAGLLAMMIHDNSHPNHPG